MAIQRDIRTRFIGEDRTGPATASATRRAKSLAGAYDTAARRIATANRLIASVSLGVAGSNIVQTVANLQNSQARLSAVTKTLAADQAFLSRTAQRMSLDIEQAYTTMARLRVLETSGSIRQGNTEKILEGLGDAFARFGASAGQRENVIYGLAQALGQGQLQAQELNQVVEPLPGLLADIAAVTGRTAAEYRQLVKDGKVTSEMFEQDLLRAIGSYAGAAERLSGNVQQSLTRMSNAYKELLLTFSEPIANNIGGLANSVGNVLRVLNDNADLVSNVVKLGFTALIASFGAKALNAIGSFTKKYISAAEERRNAIFREAQAAKLKSQIEEATASRSAALAAQQKLITKNEEKATLLKKQQTAQEKLTSAEQKKQDALRKQAQLVKRRDAIFDKKNAADILVQSRATSARIAEQAVAEKELALLQSKGKTERKAALAELATAEKAYLATQKRVATAIKEREVVERQLAKAQTLRAAQTDRVAKARQEQLAADQNLLIIGREINKAEKVRGALATNANKRNVASIRSAAELAKAQSRVNAGLRLTSTIATAATGALNLLKGAFNLIGGPVGAFIIGVPIITSLVGKLNDTESALKRARRSFRDATSAAKDFNSTLKESEPLTPADQVATAIQAQVTALKNYESSIQDVIQGEKDFQENLKKLPKGLFNYQEALQASDNTTDILTERTDELRLRIGRLRYEMARLSDSVGSQGATYGVAIDNLNTIEAQERRRLEAAINQTKELDEQQNKIKEIRDTIDELRAGRDLAVKFKVNEEQIAQFDRVLAEQQAKLNEATGATKSREEAEERIRDLISDQNQIRESTRSQEEKILDQLETQLETLDKIAKLPVSTVGRLSEADLAETRVQVQKAANDELIKLDVERHNNQLQLTEARIERELQAENAKYSTLQQKIQALAERADPVRAARNQLIDEETTLREANIAGLLNDEELRRKIITDIRVKNAKLIADAEAEAAREARTKALKVDEIEKFGGLTNEYLDALRPLVGQYQEITDQMSEAEKKAAEESNRANKRRFEKDKRLRKRAAIIDTLAGAARAIADDGWFGLARAGAIILAGRKIVRGIERETFGGTSGSNGASLGSNRGQPGSDAVTTATNVIIIDSGSGGKAAAVARASGSLKELDAQLKSNNIAVSMNGLTISDAKYIRSKAG